MKFGQLAAALGAVAFTLAFAGGADAASKTMVLKGTWSGGLNQVARAKQFNVALTLDGRRGTSTYPDEHCSGKLSRIGTSGDTVAYAETITQGKFDATKNTGCLDGTYTLVHGDNGLVVGWLGAHDGKPIVAYGVLSEQMASK